MAVQKISYDFFMRIGTLIVVEILAFASLLYLGQMQYATAADGIGSIAIGILYGICVIVTVGLFLICALFCRWSNPRYNRLALLNVVLAFFCLPIGNFIAPAFKAMFEGFARAQ